MVSDEDLERVFEDITVTIENVAILDKLKEICTLHRLNVSQIVDEWISFAVTNGWEHEPTLARLEEFERKYSMEQRNKPFQMSRHEGPTVMFDKHSIDQLMTEEDDDDDVDIMESYQTPSNKKGSVKRQHTTPEMTNYKRHTSQSHTPAAVPFSPASFSPASTATPSAKYGSRNNAGEVVCSFNPNRVAARDIQWTQEQGSVLSIRHVDQSRAVKSGFKYMFQKQADKSAVLNDIIDDMAEKLLKHCGIEEFSQLSVPAQEEVTVVGRVCCDANGKLNAKSVVLEGSLDTSHGHMVRLDLSKLSQFALFPGQVIVASGLNTRGDTFSVNKIYEGVQLPFYSVLSKDDEIEMDLGDAKGSFSMMVAAGPFTTSDSTMYEPLNDLIKAVQKDKPDLLIMLGPFVDAKHEQIEKDDFSCTFEDLFNKQVENIVKATEGQATSIVFVPSLRDIHHDYVYPQPPYTCIGKYEDMKRVHFVSDPSTLLVNGVVIGVTSMDILLQLGSEETACPPGSSDRLGRLVKHVLLQHSYYPLQPPNEDVNLDYEQFAKSCFLPCTPDIMILPSDLRYFAKEVLGCLCINPGRLAKGRVGGTYLQLLVKPGQKSSETNSSILQNSLAQILRI